MRKAALWWIIVDLAIALAAGLVGGFSASYFLSKDKEIELTNLSLRERKLLYEETSRLISTRLHNTRKLTWSYDRIKAINDISPSTVKAIEKAYQAYILSVDAYNVHVRIIANQLAFLFDEQLANMFARENDNERSPEGIACQFINLHANLVALYKNIRKKDDINYRSAIAQIHRQQERLQQNIFAFMNIFAQRCFDKGNIRRDLHN